MKTKPKIVWGINDAPCGAYEVIECEIEGPYKTSRKGDLSLICVSGIRMGQRFVCNTHEIFETKAQAEFIANYLRNAYKWGHNVGSLNKEREIKERIFGKSLF